MTTTNTSGQAASLDLDKLEALAKSATPGPRTFGSKYVAKPQHGTYAYIAQCPDGTEDTPEWEADACFIAACDPPTILALIELARSAALAAPQPSAEPAPAACDLTDYKTPVVQSNSARIAAPAAPAVAPTLPTVCDGKEQDEFEKWAAGDKFDMTRHPLHWLFLNHCTAAARKGWKAALDYVSRVAPQPAPAPLNGFVQVPVEAYLWLMGMGRDSFSPSGQGAFWWRSAFNERAGLDMMAIYEASKAGAAPLNRVSEQDAIATAYGYLWHVNAAMDAPAECGVLSVSPERAAYEARKVLRDLLTHEQRGQGINAVRENLAAMTATPSKQVGDA